MKPETLCLHAGYEPENGQARVLPITQSTTFRYTSAANVARLFDLEEAGFFYTRLGNPTVDAVERKIAALYGGVGAMCTSSGQSAVLTGVLNLARAGDHVISSSSIYGGVFNLLGVTLRRLGIEVTFVDQDWDNERLAREIRPNTRLIYAETLANPALSVLDISRFAELAHSHDLPLMVDNTFATPVLCNPFDFGADIVVDSTTKYMDGHALQMGGCITDSGRFDWTCGKYPEFTEPDASYHGLVFGQAFGSNAFLARARALLMRDLGCCQSPQGAFYLNLGLETLPLRMERHCGNALAVAMMLERQPGVESVRYPGLEGDRYHALARRYLPHGASGVISFVLRGGREAGVRFLDSLKLISLEVHVADIRTCVLHPASSTHRQLDDAQLKEAGITPGLIRLSVGLENLEDILEDLTRGLENA